LDQEALQAAEPQPSQGQGASRGKGPGKRKSSSLTQAVKVETQVSRKERLREEELSLAQANKGLVPSCSVSRGASGDVIIETPLPLKGGRIGMLSLW
jgi:hypothetical protein